MRFIIDIETGADGVQGRLRRVGDDAEWRFSGWLQLIGFLEPGRSSGSTNDQTPGGW